MKTMVLAQLLTLGVALGEINDGGRPARAEGALWGVLVGHELNEMFQCLHHQGEICRAVALVRLWKLSPLFPLPRFEGLSDKFPDKAPKNSELPSGIRPFQFNPKWSVESDPMGSPVSSPGGLRIPIPDWSRFMGGGAGAGGDFGGPSGTSPLGGHEEAFSSTSRHPQFRATRDPNSLPDLLSDAPFPEGELLPAKNGIAAFEIMGQGESTPNGRMYQYCMNSFIGTTADGACEHLTAAHCALSGHGQKVTHYNTAYGSFNAKVTFPSHLGYVHTDVALLTEKGPTCDAIKEQLKPLAFRESPLREGEKVYGVSRYFAKLIAGRVKDHSSGTSEIDFDFLSRDGRGHQGGIHSGDSGSPLLAWNADTQQFEIGGVLSASTEASQAHADRNGNPTIGGLEGYYPSDLTGLVDDLRRRRMGSSDFTT
jgi:hypothetical protein